MYFCSCVVVVVVVAVVDDDDKVHTATTLDCCPCHNHCYWLPFSEAACCSVNYSEKFASCLHVTMDPCFFAVMADWAYV